MVFRSGNQSPCSVRSSCSPLKVSLEFRLGLAQLCSVGLSLLFTVVAVQPQKAPDSSGTCQSRVSDSVGMKAELGVHSFNKFLSGVGSGDSLGTQRPSKCCFLFAQLSFHSGDHLSPSLQLPLFPVQNTQRSNCQNPAP